MSTDDFIGIDVSKDNLDIAVYPKNDFSTIPINQDGLNELINSFQVIEPELIVLEETGGYIMLAASTLFAASLPVVVVNAR